MTEKSEMEQNRINRMNQDKHNIMGQCDYTVEEVAINQAKRRKRRKCKDHLRTFLCDDDMTIFGVMIR